MDETATERQDELVPAQTALAGRYRIERELGRGGMATVYLARDLAEDRDVAVKLLLPELTSTVGNDRFLREIQVGRTLQHPGIVSVLDSGRADEQLFYVMPFVEGESLRDRINREKQLPIDDAIDIVSQVADALAYAHEQGVIHRDIKPENILLGKDRAWVADFGIAHALGVAGGDNLTRTGMTVGTPTYMSPEQALQSRDVTGASDVYSLACVLYEMLAGQPPFTGPTAMALIARHSLDNVPSLKIVRGTIPAAVEDAIAKAMAKVPADRYRTAHEFAAALRDDEAAERRAAQRTAQSMRAAQQAAAPGKRRRIVLIAAAAGLAIAAAGGAWFATHRGPKVPEGLAGDFAKTNIAVLYFEDRTPGKQLDYVAEGLTEALIRDLSAVTQLHVISRNGVAPYRGKVVPTDSIKKALKVGTIVTGTLSQAGDKLRVDVDLVDAVSGDNMGSARLEQPRQALLALQDSLATDISVILRKKVGGEIAALVSRTGTRNDRAWESMERAQKHIAGADPLLAAGDVRAAAARLAEADTMLAAVESIDDHWARPIVQRGWIAYRTSRLLGASDPTQIPKLLDAGLAHAERALAKAPKDADALELRGTLRYWRWILNLAPDPNASTQLLSSAQADLKASTDANATQASAWNTLSHLYMATSRTAEGKIAADNAYKADPYLANVDQTVWRLFSASLDLNVPNEAQKWCDEGQRRFPGHFRFVECRLWLNTFVGKKPDVADVWRTYDELVKATPKNLQAFMQLRGRMVVAIALIRAGLPDSARAVAKSARGNPNVDPSGELTYLEAIVRAQVGDKDDAIRLLTRFLAANPQQRALASHDESWWFDDIKDEPRYKALVGASS